MRRALSSLLLLGAPVLAASAQRPILTHQMELIAPFIQPNTFLSMHRGALNVPDSLRWELHLDTPFLLNRGDWSKVTFAVTPDVIFRKRRDDPVQIRTPSYMPRLEAWAWWPGIIPGLKTDTSRGRLWYYSARFWNHHSNGQQGDFHAPDSLHRNEADGSWSTNFWEAGGNWRARFLSDSSAYAVYLGYRRYINYADFHPAHDQPLDSSYGVHRLIGRTQISLRHVAVGLPFEEIHLSAEATRLLDAARNIEPQYRTGNGRYLLSLTASAEPQCLWWPDDFAVFASYYTGQDYYNIEYGHRRSFLRLGISSRAVPSPRNSAHDAATPQVRIPGCSPDRENAARAARLQASAETREDPCARPVLAWCLIDPFLERSFVTVLGGIGNMGDQLFEARGVPHFVSRDELEERQAFGVNFGKLAFDFEPAVTLRMLRLNSSPVLSPSFMPRLTAYWFPSTATSVSSRRLTYYTLSGFQHTNLESNPVFPGPGLVDTAHGRFNTWGASGGIHHTAPILTASQYTASLSATRLLEYHLTPELQGTYGRDRVTGDIQIIVPVSFLGGSLWVDGNAEVLLDGARFAQTPQASSFDRHSILALTASYQPPFFDQAAIFASLYRGQDYYNTRFTRELRSLTFGLSLQEHTITGGVLSRR